MSDYVALEAQIGAMHRSITGIQSTLDKVAEAITRLAVLEERDTNRARDIQWCKDGLGDVSRRLKALEETNIRYTAVASTLTKTVRVAWMVGGTAVGVAATQIMSMLQG